MEGNSLDFFKKLSSNIGEPSGSLYLRVLICDILGNFSSSAKSLVPLLMFEVSGAVGSSWLLLSIDI